MVDKTANTKQKAARKTRTRTQPVSMQRGPDFSAEQVAFLVSAASAGFSGQHTNAVQTVNSNTNAGSASTGSSAPSTPRAARSNVASITGSRPGRKPDATSGLSRARALYAKMDGKDRSAIVKAFIDKVGLKDSVANTYYHLIAGKKDGTTRGRRAKTQTQAAATA